MKTQIYREGVILLLLFILNIIIRFPVVSHEVGTDGFFVHELANSILNYGYAKWILHPLSFFGLFPLSYPSTQPFLLASISSISKITIEYAVLFNGFFLAIVGTFSSYILALKVRNDRLFAFFVAFVFSLSPIFLRYTSWEGSSRGLFIALWPLFIFLILSLREKYKNKYNLYILLVFLMIFILATHRVSFFLFITIAAFFLSLILERIYNTNLIVKIINKLTPKIVSVHIFYILLIFSIIFFLVQFSGLSFYTGSYSAKLSTGFLNPSSEGGLLNSVINMATSYFGKIGILFSLALIGYFLFFFKTLYDFNTRFIILNILFSLPLLGLKDYMPLFLLPFFSVLIGLTVLAILNKIDQRKIIKKYIIIVFLIISMVFSMYVLFHWRSDISTYQPISEPTYNAANFITGKTNNTIITNVGGYGVEISAISGRPVLPLGGASVHWISPGQLIYDFENQSEMSFIPIEFSQLSLQSDYILDVKGVSNAKDDWANNIMYNKVDSKIARDTLKKYRISYLYRVEGLPDKIAYYGYRQSDFLVDLAGKGNKIFDDSIGSIWYLDEK